MLAVLERRYRGRILTLVHMVGNSSSSHLRRFMKSVSTRSQTTGGCRWKSLHVQSGLSVEVPSSASQRIVLSSSSASQFLVFLLSSPCSAGQGYCSRYPGVTTGIGSQSSGASVFIAECDPFCAMQARFELNVANSEDSVVNVKARVVPYVLLV